ncbi:MAG TPA: MFS transporter [Lautropia sp.]|nr:MFS transporter [Lautropia sp.]
MLYQLARRLPFYYGWLVVAVVFVTMGVGVNARTAFSLLYPPILDEFGWERGVTAGVFSFGFLMSAILSPLFGRMMDSHGPRTVTLLGVVATAAGLSLAAWSTEPWHFYATLGLLVGSGSVCLGYSCQALFLPAWFERRRGLAMSIAFAGVGVGSIVLLPLLQRLIEVYGWRSACLALGLFALALLTPLALLLRRRPEDIGLQPDGATNTAGAAAAARRAYVVDAAWVAVDWTLARAVRTTRFWWLALGYFCGLFAWYLVQVHQTKYLVEVGFSASEAAWALGWVSLAGVPGQIALGQLSDRVGREIVWSIGSFGFLLTYAALLLLPANPNLGLLVFMVLVQGALGYGVTSVFGAIPAEIFEGRHYGSIFGVLMLVALTGGAIGPLVGGMLHDWTGGYELAFWLAMSLIVLSAIAIWQAAPRRVRAVAGRVARLQA